MKPEQDLNSLMTSLRQSIERNSLDFVALEGATLYEAIGVTLLNADDYDAMQALKSAAVNAQLHLYCHVDFEGREDVISVILSMKEFPLWANGICATMEERIDILKRDYSLNGAIVAPRN